MNNITKWLSENRLAASLLAFLVIGTGLLGWLAYGAWDDLDKATTEYSSKAKTLIDFSKQKPFPSQDNLAKLTSTIETEKTDLNRLLKELQRFQIPPFAGLAKINPQDRPQRFQDLLRNEVTRIKSVATSDGAIFPQGFYLGLEDYENRPPAAEETLMLAKQLTVMSWVAEILANHKDLNLEEFSIFKPEASSKKDLLKQAKKASEGPLASAKPTLPYETANSLSIKFRCNQSSFREIVNSLSTGPYFLMIDQILIENSVKEPPRRDLAAHQSPATPQEGAAAIQRLPIIVGREMLTVTIKLGALEFPDRAATAAPSSLNQPK
jgi:hypothetical protein